MLGKKINTETQLRGIFVKHIIFVVLFSSVSVFAGVMNGGGGKGVVCKDIQGQIASVELLDLWEARALFNEQPNLPLPKNLAAAVSVILDQLKISYPFYGQKASPGKKCKNEDCLLQMLTQQANLFLSPNNDVVRLRNVVLELTTDSYEVARPSTCEIQQIINYQPGKIWVNQDLYEKLNFANQAALIAHEAYYAVLRSLAQEVTSIRTRRAVGYVMSGNQFLLTPADIIPAGALYCTHEGIPYAPTVLYLTGKPDPNSPDNILFNVHPLLSSGSDYIGASTRNLRGFGISTKIFAQIFSGQCEKDGLTSQFGFDLNGPVEFDRKLILGFMCKDKKLQTYFKDLRATDSDAPAVLLNCAIR